MKILEQSTQHVIDVVCDRCNQSTLSARGELLFASLNAGRGQGSDHPGEAYELHLCVPCVFALLAGLKRDRWTLTMFTCGADAIRDDDGFGRVPTADRSNE